MCVLAKSLWGQPGGEDVGVRVGARTGIEWERPQGGDPVEWVWGTPDEYS